MRENDHLPRNWRLMPPLVKEANAKYWAGMNRMVAQTKGRVGNNLNGEAKAKRKARITLAKVL